MWICPPPPRLPFFISLLADVDYINTPVFFSCIRVLFFLSAMTMTSLSALVMMLAAATQVRGVPRVFS